MNNYKEPESNGSMKSISEVMDRLKEKTELARQRARTNEPNDYDSETPESYNCPICKDLEIILDGWHGYPCKCKEEKNTRRRLKKAAIPPELEKESFKTYQRETEQQEKLYKGITDYLRDFNDIIAYEDPHNSLGFLAEVGETYIKQLGPKEREEAKLKYNSYGLGKTHLQISAAKYLIKQGYTVLVISDSIFMEDLMNARRADDAGARYNELVDAVTRVDVLVWDDIGKSKHSDAKESAYYQIINERYKRLAPIIWSTNEDHMTLEDKIGPAASSRLIGMSKGRIFAAQGPDFRKK